MKKILVACLAIACFVGVASAQLADISIVTTKLTPDRTFKERVATDLDTIKDAVNVLNAGSLSNATVSVTVSNITITGTLTAPADSLDPADLAGGTLPDDVVSAEFTIDGKYAITGGDATTGLMVQKAARTAGTNATETIAFAVVFGAAPVVVCTYTEDPGDVRPIFVTSVTASNFVANITADKNYGYVAVGTRP